MRSSVIVAAEGVLITDTWKVIETGKHFIQSLSSVYRVTVALNHNEVDRFKLWLQMENVSGVDEVLPSATPMSYRGVDERIAQVEMMSRRGYDLAFLVDSDPERVAGCLAQGYDAIMFCSAKFQRPEFRPDYDSSVKSWDSLVQEMEMQAYLRSQVDN